MNDEEPNLDDPVPRAFDEAAFDEATSRPSGWTEVPDPVAEVRKLRGDTTQGNAAKIRETLVIMRDMLIDGGNDAQCRAEIVTICNAALAAPARNCDVGETDDQECRFERLCNAFSHCAGCPVYKRWGKRPKSCGIIWAQMTYEAKEKSNVPNKNIP